MAYIKKIQLPGVDQTYDIRDAEALHNIQYNRTNKAIQKSFDGTTYSDVITLEALKQDMGLSAALNYKGTVANREALPTTGNNPGDVYTAQDTGSEYVWVPAKDGEPAKWEPLGQHVDLSGYVTKKEYDKHGHSVTVSGTNEDSDVTGTFTTTDQFVKTVTEDNIDIALDDGVTLDTDEATVVGDIAVSSKQALGVNATFTTTGGTGTTTKLSATATDGAVTLQKSAAGTQVLTSIDESKVTKMVLS